MYVEIDEKIIKQVEEITITNYEAEGNKVPLDSIQPMIEDLLHEIECLKEDK